MCIRDSFIPHGKDPDSYRDVVIEKLRKFAAVAEKHEDVYKRQGSNRTSASRKPLTQSPSRTAPASLKATPLVMVTRDVYKRQPDGSKPPRARMCL